MDSRNAIRPDQRWAAPIQLGAGVGGSLPYITSADSSCRMAKKTTAEATHTFTVRGLEKPATFTAIPVGWCSRPSTPRVTDTAPPIVSGTRSLATLPVRAGSADGLGSAVIESSPASRAVGGQNPLPVVPLIGVAVSGVPPTTVPPVDVFSAGAGAGVPAVSSTPT